MSVGSAPPTPEAAVARRDILFVDSYARDPGGYEEKDPETSDWNSWEAMSKDLDIVDVATITAYAMGIRSTLKSIEIEVVPNPGESQLESHPSTEASTISGYKLVGGGAKADYSESGNYLTASYPKDPMTWEAMSKDHIHPDPARLTACALGIKISLTGS